MSLLLFPFKAYVIIIPVWGIIQQHESYYVREAQMRATDYILMAYAACILVFIVAAIIQFIRHRRKQAIESALFAASTFIALWFLVPFFALAR